MYRCLGVEWPRHAWDQQISSSRSTFVLAGRRVRKPLGEEYPRCETGEPFQQGSTSNFLILFHRHFAASWCRWGFSVIEMLGVTTMD